MVSYTTVISFRIAVTHSFKLAVEFRDPSRSVIMELQVSGAFFRSQGYLRKKEDQEEIEDYRSVALSVTLV